MAVEKLSEYQDDFVGIYKKHMNEIELYVARELKGGDFIYAKGQKRIESTLKSKFSNMVSSMQSYMERESKRLANEQSGRLFDDLQAAGLHQEQTRTQIRKANKKLAVNSTTNNINYVVNQAQKMRGDIMSQVKRFTQEVSQKSRVEGKAKKQVVGEMRGKFLERTLEHNFQDSKFRRWDSQVYFSMFAKTYFGNLEREIYSNGMSLSGNDLVKISSHNAEDNCRFYENEVVSLTGSTPGYRTLQEITGPRKIFHPRCRHTYTAYSPDTGE